MADSNLDLHNAADVVWRRAKDREPVIRHLAALDSIPEADMLDAIDQLNLSRSRIYSLVRRYRLNSVASALLPRKPGPARGYSRLLPEVEDLIERLLDEVYLKRQKPNVAALCRSIAHACKVWGLPPPTRKAVAARLSRRPASTTVRRREGKKKADDLYRPVVQTYEADYALQVVQIDHTPVDLIVVDEQNRKPIGRPWVTFAIDVASRAVVGFYVTLEHPSAISVAMTIRHAVLPKEAWLADRGISASWMVSGIPDSLHMDNAKEFHSRALARGCDEYGIEQLFRPLKTPHFGGHIERLIGTMMGAVHLLPGTTFSNIAEKGDYDSATTSAMTLSELELWLTTQIVGVYHASLHSGIGRPPNVSWQDALECRPRPVQYPQDPEKFLLDFLPFEYRKIRRDGIRMFNISYWDPVLSGWVGQSSLFAIKYDPRDLSRVFLQAPDGRHWPIPYADLGKPAITLWEQKQAMALIRETGRAGVDERLIFDAVEAQRALIASAVSKTSKVRRSASRLVNALGDKLTAGQPRLVEPVQGAPETADSYLPYPVEDWS